MLSPQPILSSLPMLSPPLMLSPPPSPGSLAISENQQPPMPSQPEEPPSLPSPLPPRPSEDALAPTAIEIEVLPHAAKVRQRSASKYNKRHAIEAFSPGDVVSIRVPREDRTATNQHRMFCRVLAAPHHNRYKLQTAHGVLNVHYPVTVLNRVPPEACLHVAANIPETELPNVITLHAASAKMSTSEWISVKILP